MSKVPQDPVERIRDAWRRGSPPEKLGVTERYVVFGEARRWMIDRLALPDNALVLEVGFGHGFLSFEAALRSKAQIVSIDCLRGEQPKSASHWSKVTGLNDRILWVVSDVRLMSFPDRRFDAVISFLALQDIGMTGGETGFERAVEDSCRVLKPGGTIGLADNMFPECARDESQKLYWRIQSDEFRATVPSKEVFRRRLEKYGMTGLVEYQYDPRITLNEKEAKIELMDIVEAKPFGMELGFDSLWTKYGREIRKTGLSYPNILLIQGEKAPSSPA